MALKFIINNKKELIIGDVDFHSYLLKEDQTATACGKWYFDLNTKKMYLFGCSTHYGDLTPKAVEDSLKPADWDNYTIMFDNSISTEENLIKKYQIEPNSIRCGIKWCESGESPIYDVYEFYLSINIPTCICFSCASELLMKPGDLFPSMEIVKQKIINLYLHK
jgi:hypothetical protein